MIHLLAVISAALAVIFFAWHIAHGVWVPEFFFLCAFLLELIAHHEKWPY